MDREFFFSSRRRHTRCSRDWSSDVCSSDLGDSGNVSHRIGDAHRLTVAEEIPVVVTELLLVHVCSEPQRLLARTRYLEVSASDEDRGRSNGGERPSPKSVV